MGKNQMDLDPNTIEQQLEVQLNQPSVKTTVEQQNEAQQNQPFAKTMVDPQSPEQASNEIVEMPGDNRKRKREKWGKKARKKENYDAVNPDEQYEPVKPTPEEQYELVKKPAPEEDRRVLGIGEYMITILIYLLPGINIIMMAVWAFSTRGNINRRNLSRACLLWLIILLLGYVVAMTVAGYTILDIFPPKV